MTTLLNRASVYVLRYDTDGLVVGVDLPRDNTVLAWHDVEPDVVWVVTATSTVGVTYDGACLALTGPIDEPSGGVTVRPAACTAGLEWWVADVQTGAERAEYTVDAETMCAFLGDVAAARRMAAVSVGEREWEPPVRPQGGAA